MTDSTKPLPIAAPAATVFISSACIMMLEIVAGRLAARYIGASLYTWTSVIGVVLAGIALGNYFGGRLAERLAAGKMLAVLFAVCSGACVVAIILNNLIADWTLLLQLGLPLRALAHIAIVFFIPAAALGAVSPILVKTALQSRLTKGRTVGDIYAAGAAGSILGTFVAGFWLIAAVGIANTLWLVATVLLLLAILYRPKSVFLYVFTAILFFLMLAATASAGWAKRLGSALALKPRHDPQILYEVESQYGYIAVQQLSKYPDLRQFIQNNMRIQSRLKMDDIRDLQLFYSKAYAAVTRRLAADKKKLCVLGIGGGGYVFPRYIQATWPGSRVDVAEIDPKVTETAILAFGLAPDSPINTINLDGRNYLDGLLAKKKRGEPAPVYDFVYMDAFNDLSVPFQLVTRQFNEKIFAALAGDGAYIINLIDMFDCGKFLASFVHTVKQTFPFVYIVTKSSPHDFGSNFIIVASKQQVDLENLDADELLADTPLWVFNDRDFAALEAKGPIVLRDDYAPVENLLAPFVVHTDKVALADKYLNQAEELSATPGWKQGISRCRQAAQICPPLAIKAYNIMGRIYADHGNLAEAAASYRTALLLNDQAEVKTNVSGIHYSIAVVLKKLGNHNEAREHFDAAIEQLQTALAVKPGSAEILSRLGHVFATEGNMSEAIEYFRRALEAQPTDLSCHLTLARALAADRKYDEAGRQLDESIKYMLSRGSPDEAEQLKNLRTQLQAEKKQRQNQ
jgi:tetratricopeptide (TPR) repeat protein/MFS family permease